jgi:hypothetical protein
VGANCVVRDESRTPRILGLFTALAIAAVLLIAPVLAASARPAAALARARTLTVAPRTSAPHINAQRVASEVEHNIASATPGVKIGSASGMPRTFETPFLGVSQPAVAWNGSEYLVVWVSNLGLRGPSHIYATRVSPSGVALDLNGIVVNAASDSGFPSVVWNGSNFVVVWQDWRNSTAASDIYGARVNGAGDVLDPLGIAISTASNDQGVPRAAVIGSTVLVVWEDGRNDPSNPDIYGARLDNTGAVLDPAGIPISTAAGAQHRPAVAADASHFLVAWTDERNGAYELDIYGARVNTKGTVLDSAGIAISNEVADQSDVSVAANANSFFAAWTDQRNQGTRSDIYGARLSDAGTVLDSTGIAISTVAADHGASATAWNGSNFMVTWLDDRLSAVHYDIFGTRVSTAGAVLDGASGKAIVTSSDGEGSSVLASNGNGVFVVLESNPGYEDIVGTRVDASAHVLDTPPKPLSTMATEQLNPAVAFDGTDYLVVWTDFGIPTTLVRGARVSNGGKLLDPNGISIGTTSYYDTLPSVAWNGTNFFVTWTDVTPDVHGARVTPGGAVLDPTGILLGSNASSGATVASDGTNFLVTWQTQQQNVVALRVTNGGVVLDAPTTVSHNPASAAGTGPAVGWDGSTFLVVWERSDGSNDDLSAARLNGSLTELDGSDLTLVSGTTNHLGPAIAWSGSKWLVTWTTISAGAYSIDGVLVNATGAPAGPTFPVRSNAATGNGSPAVAWNGTDFLVAWLESDGSAVRVRAARVDGHGTVLDPANFTIDSDADEGASVASGSGGKWLVGYGAIAPSRGYQVPEVFTRTVAPK